jgi:2-dehydropantoate 2-reductase
MRLEASARIAIVGAGAMGCIFGAALAEANVDVTLIDVSHRVVNEINASGVTVVRDGVERTVSVRATTDPGALGAVDVAIVFVKNYHTASAAESMRPLVAANSLVVSLQNGWGNEEVLAAAFGPERVAAGVTYHSGTSLGVGRVSHNAPGPTFIGPYEGDDVTPCHQVANALSLAGFDISATAEARTEVWKKLVFNSAGLAVGALTGLDPRAMMEDDAVRDLVFATARESVEVARASGYDLDPEERVDTISRAFAATAPGTKGSMRQDVEAQRPTEVDAINGAVVRGAEQSSRDAVLNRALLALMKGYEAALAPGDGGGRSARG